jgi:hypothetical protein
MALQAGAAETCYSELLELGLIAVPAAVVVPPVDIALPDTQPAPLVREADSRSGAASELPSGMSRFPDSLLVELKTVAATTAEQPLEEARTMLMHALRKEAPVVGALTLLKVKRALDLSELNALIDEVESHIVKPSRSLAAQQVLRRARQLLAKPVQPLAAN